MSTYTDKLVSELELEGIKPLNSYSNKVVRYDDLDLNVILGIEKATGIKYSDEQKKVLKHRGNACILACAGSGKALDINTLVLTPIGYKPIGVLKVGDIVLDHNGNKQEVLGVFPQGNKEVYRVKFNTGKYVKACKDHLWITGGKEEKSRVYSTEALYKLLENYKNEPIEIPRFNVLRDASNECIELNSEIYGEQRSNRYNLSKEELRRLEKFMCVFNTHIDELESLTNSEIIDKLYLNSIMSYNSQFGLKPFDKDNKFRVSFEMAKNIRTFNRLIGVPCGIRVKDGEYFVQYKEDKRELIVSIEKTDEIAEMVCIKVSGKSEDFVLDDFIITHNTTVSTHLIAKRILTGEISDTNKMIYTTYSKSGAVEMKDRLDKLLKQLGINKNIQVRTMHSFFLQVLRIFGVTANIIEQKDRTRFIREACKEAKFTLKDDDLILIDNLLSYQVNNLLSDKKTVESYVNTIEDLSVDIYSHIRNGYANKKAINGLIDYDDMQSYLYLWLCKYAKSDKQEEVTVSNQVRNYCRCMWTDFYIDEAQDISKIQFAIIRAMITDPSEPNNLLSNLVLIGDDDQCIYTWRGSDPNIILTVGPLFNMKVFKLTTNYRCKNEIVDFAASGIKHNNTRYEKDMKAFNNGGQVKIIPSQKKDLYSLSVIAFYHIKKLIADGEKISDIAVLSRNNFHLALLSNMLLREGIYSYLTEDMKLTKSYMYKDIKAIIDMCTPSWKTETTNVLWKLCRYMSAFTASVISKFQSSSGLSLEDCLGYIIKNYINKNLDFDKKLIIPIQEEKKLEYYIRYMKKETTDDLEIVYSAIKSNNKEDCLNILMYQYLSTCSFLYKSNDKNRSIKGLISYIKIMLQQDGFDNMCEFLRVTEQFENGKVGVIGDRVTLTTIHSAKGREWKNVIMFACDNVSQPSFDGITKMINDGISESDISNHLDEERRLFYVGSTRAKENLLYITYREPSIFIMEALGAFGQPLSGIENNSRIIYYAKSNDNALYTDFSEFINSNIFDTSSKHYYSLNI